MSWRIANQRLVLFRGVDGAAKALDAFCPHMGADLSTGKVTGNELQCYFHQWCFNGQGQVTRIPCADGKTPKVKINSYPVEEKFGWIWVYSHTEAAYPIPHPAGLEGQELTAVHVGSPTLFAHHHVMMASGIDIQHFATVHNLDIKFELTTRESHPHVFDWDLKGELPITGWRARFARRFIGSSVGYVARFAGGTIVTLTYNPEGTKVKLGPFRFRIPPVHIFWGAIPLESGVSRVEVFFANRKRTGLFGGLKSWGMFAITAVLLVVLRDDDVKAFPGMRFNTGHLLPIDSSVAKLIAKINTLPLSSWSKQKADNRIPSTENGELLNGHPPANA